MNHQLGVIGLGTMGANLARNAARNGARVAVYNRTAEKTDAFMKNFGKEGDFVAAKTYKEFLAALKPPRPLLLMVQAGKPVDAVIDELRPFLSKGDIIIDGGNSHYRDTARRAEALQAKGIKYLGLGVSGGEEGALHGPSMMPGGDEASYNTLAPLLQKMAAEDGEGGRCIGYLGPGGAGHFVKMVHNGIEYGLMQLLAEAYHLLKSGGASNAEIGKAFATWNDDPSLRSYLLEITAQIFTKRDDMSKKDLLDVIKDAAAQKGTGKWTTDAAMTYGVAVPTITAGVDARIMSSAKEFRMEQAKQMPLQPVASSFPHMNEAVRDALELSVLNTYAQGFQLLSVASTEEKWNLPVPEIIRLWQGGCIIRADLLRVYRKAFSGDKDASAELRGRLSKEREGNWRHVLAHGALRAIPLPAMNASLSYYDSYRSAWLPQNLTQAQRDFFGAHGFERLDKSGTFHETWSESTKH